MYFSITVGKFVRQELWGPMSRPSVMQFLTKTIAILYVGPREVGLPWHMLHSGSVPDTELQTYVFISVLLFFTMVSSVYIKVRIEITY